MSQEGRQEAKERLGDPMSQEIGQGARVKSKLMFFVNDSFIKNRLK